MLGSLLGQRDENTMMAFEVRGTKPIVGALFGCEHGRAQSRQWR